MIGVDTQWGLSCFLKSGDCWTTNRDQARSLDGDGGTGMGFYTARQNCSLHLERLACGRESVNQLARAFEGTGRYGQSRMMSRGRLLAGRRNPLAMRSKNGEATSGAIVQIVILLALAGVGEDHLVWLSPAVNFLV